MRSLFKALSLVPLVIAFQYNVDVGKNDITGQKGIGFDPSEIFPSVGDVVNFVIQSGTHSVDESTFALPCTPNGGLTSSPTTVPSSSALDAPGLPVVEIFINDTAPRWFFDGASGACQQGAVFAINPTSDQNFTAFLANAAADATPATTSSSGSGTGTSSSTAARSTKTNAAAKHDFAAGSAVWLLLASVIGMM